MVKIFFPYYEQYLEVPEGTKVSEACELAGHPLNLVCGGNGRCGKCLVVVREVNRTAQVLACQYEVSNGMKIYVSDDDSEKKILTESVIFDPIRFDPPTDNYPIVTEALDGRDGPSLLMSLNEILPIEVVCDDEIALARYAKTIRETDKQIVNAVIDCGNLITLTANDAPMEALGMAFDIGTTTVVGYLYDLVDGTLLSQASSDNGQKVYGADVVSRIQAAGEGKTKDLQKAVLASIDELIADCLTESQCEAEDIIHLVFCGNTTMLSLFAGISPESLGNAPFTAPISGEQKYSSSDFNFQTHLNSHCVIRLLSPIGSFVGSDTTALLTALPKREGKSLVIDLGTNAELAVGSGMEWTVCSAPCGPALEGDGITMGMRGEKGAIEKIHYQDGRFEISVIGGGPARGICGSGIIDAVSALINCGMLTREGSFASGQSLADNDEAWRLSDDGSFTLMTEMENRGGPAIVITQKDIRAVQLVKAAVDASTHLLMKAADIRPDEIKTIYLSGAFGNYIRTESAADIGLIPSIADSISCSIGNGAGTGAVRCLLSINDLEKNRRIAENAESLNFADGPEFSEAYIGAMRFAPSFNGEGK